MSLLNMGDWAYFVLFESEQKSSVFLGVFLPLSIENLPNNIFVEFPSWFDFELEVVASELHFAAVPC